MLNMISIAAGAVIGGWLAEAPYWFSVTGAGAASLSRLGPAPNSCRVSLRRLSAMLPFCFIGQCVDRQCMGHRATVYELMMYLVQVVEPL